MAKNTLLKDSLPSEVRVAIRSLGEHLKIARKRRRETEEHFARRLMVSAPTLRRMEAGDPGLALGTVATALWALGMLPDFRRLADPNEDAVGKALELKRLPKSIRPSRVGMSDDF
jgi:transcriptional regulator with XRE-family HTH domain